jgi:hypothetical protein
MPKGFVVPISVVAAIGILIWLLPRVIHIDTPGTRQCMSYPVMSIPSPTGEFQVFAENVSCSPSNELMTKIWVHKTGSPEFQGILTAPSAQNAAGWYSPLNFRLAWQGDSRLQISYPRSTKVESSPANLGDSIPLSSGVHVSYTELSRDSL